MDLSLWNDIVQNSEIFGYIGGKLFNREVVISYNLWFNESISSQEDLDFCLSYYSHINSFYLTNYAGSNYIYESGKRMPDYIDYMKNQLKLKSIAETKTVLTENSYKVIQKRMAGYIFAMLYNSDTKDTVMQPL